MAGCGLRVPRGAGTVTSAGSASASAIVSANAVPVVLTVVGTRTVSRLSYRAVWSVQAEAVEMTVTDLGRLRCFRCIPADVCDAAVA